MGRKVKRQGGAIHDRDAVSTQTRAMPRDQQSVRRWRSGGGGLEVACEAERSHDTNRVAPLVLVVRHLCRMVRLYAIRPWGGAPVHEFGLSMGVACSCVKLRGLAQQCVVCRMLVCLRGMPRAVCRVQRPLEGSSQAGSRPLVLDMQRTLCRGAFRTCVSVNRVSEAKPYTTLRQESLSQPVAGSGEIH